MFTKQTAFSRHNARMRTMCCYGTIGFAVLLSLNLALFATFSVHTPSARRRIPGEDLPTTVKCTWRTLEWAVDNQFRTYYCPTYGCKTNAWEVQGEFWGMETELQDLMVKASENTQPWPACPRCKENLITCHLLQKQNKELTIDKNAMIAEDVPAIAKLEGKHGEAVRQAVEQCILKTTWEWMYFKNIAEMVAAMVESGWPNANKFRKKVIRSFKDARKASDKLPELKKDIDAELKDTTSTSSNWGNKEKHLAEIIAFQKAVLSFF